MDLDQIPAQDYDLEDDHILLPGKEIVQITPKNIRDFLGVTYWTMYTRGCPYSCTYCCNDALRKINKDFTKISISFIFNNLAKYLGGLIDNLAPIMYEFKVNV